MFPTPSISNDGLAMAIGDPTGRIPVSMTSFHARRKSFVRALEKSRDEFGFALPYFEAMHPEHMHSQAQISHVDHM